MYDFRIPDEVIQKAAQKADAQHVSLDQFITEAVQFRLQDDPDNFDYLLTPELLAAIDKSAQQAKDGKSFPIEQVKERQAAKRKAWQPQ
jgi:hypothetical protein